MVSSARLPWNRILIPAVLAGVAAGTVFELYLWATTLLPAHASVAGAWQWVASTAFGRRALNDPAFAWVGAAMHAVVSMGWAGGYAYVAASRPSINRRWVLSGLVYGLVVYAIMQTILLADNHFTFPPTPNDFVNALAAHAVFFGLPVAYLVRALQRNAE